MKLRFGKDARLCASAMDRVELGCLVTCLNMREGMRSVCVWGGQKRERGEKEPSQNQIEQPPAELQ